MKKPIPVLHLWFGMLALFWGSSWMPGQAADGVSEYTLKAALILNFARFTQWPDQAFVERGQNLDLCLVDGESVGPAFRVIEGKQVNHKQLYLQLTKPIQELGNCHMVFVSGVDKALLPRIFAAVSDRPVLTIGEMPAFTELGGMINFFKIGNKIRFEVNPDAVRASGLKISSRLLKLAVIRHHPQGALVRD